MAVSLWFYDDDCFTSHSRMGTNQIKIKKCYSFAFGKPMVEQIKLKIDGILTQNQTDYIIK